jgi:hypothetical protein
MNTNELGLLLEKIGRIESLNQELLRKIDSMRVDQTPLIPWQELSRMLGGKTLQTIRNYVKNDLLPSQCSKGMWSRLDIQAWQLAKRGVFGKH